MNLNITNKLMKELNCYDVKQLKIRSEKLSDEEIIIINCLISDEKILKISEVCQILNITEDLLINKLYRSLMKLNNNLNIISIKQIVTDLIVKNTDIDTFFSTKRRK